MDVLVSPFFADNFRKLSLIFNNIGMSLEEVAICHLAKLQHLATNKTGSAPSYRVIFLSNQGEIMIPLSMFIPTNISQFMHGEDISLLDDCNELAEWQREAILHASIAMKCSMINALLAMMNAIIYAIQTETTLRFQ